MDYLVLQLRRKRFRPLRHAARPVGGKLVSLCGSVDTRHWSRRVPLDIKSPWLVSVTCPGCLKAIQRGA